VGSAIRGCQVIETRLCLGRCDMGPGHAARAASSDGMITQVRKACGPGRVRVNGVCAWRGDLTLPTILGRTRHRGTLPALFMALAV
jgi:hypothetical protein